MIQSAWFTLLAFSPMIIQPATTTQASTDILADLIKIIIGVVAISITPIALAKLKQIRTAVDEVSSAAQTNATHITDVANQGNINSSSIVDVVNRVSQLESDLSLAYKERDAAKKLVIDISLTAEQDKIYANTQIKILESRNEALSADLVAERVINAELVKAVLELKDAVKKLEERCRMLEQAEPIADAIAKQFLEKNSLS